MQTKLTLRVESRLIGRAKTCARRSGKSLSRLVSDYFTLLEEPRTDLPVDLPPLTRSLKGALAGPSVRLENYRRHLAKKYA